MAFVKCLEGTQEAVYFKIPNNSININDFTSYGFISTLSQYISSLLQPYEIDIICTSIFQKKKTGAEVKVLAPDHTMSCVLLQLLELRFESRPSASRILVPIC